MHKLDRDTDEPGLPRCRDGGVELPGGQWFVMRSGVEWSFVARVSGDTSSELLDTATSRPWFADAIGVATETIPYDTMPSRTTLVQKLDQAHTELEHAYHTRPSGRSLMALAGYIIDGLYLVVPSNRTRQLSHREALAAAMISHAFIRLWAARRHAEDDVEREYARQALPMLWRCLWRATTHLLYNVAPFRDDVRDWIAYEQARALRHWQAMCIADEWTLFFRDELPFWLRSVDETQRIPFKGTVRSWQALREAEVTETVWRIDGQQPFRTPCRKRRATYALQPPGSDRAVARRRLEYIVAEWFVPRYDLVAARDVQRRIAQAEGNWLARVSRLATGMSRVLAGSGVGFVATALQGDTYRALLALGSSRLSLLGATVLLGGLSYLVLVYRIWRNTGVNAWCRAADLWWRSEIIICCIALLVIWKLAPFMLAADDPIAPSGGRLIQPPTPIVLSCAMHVWMSLLYGQIALVSGMITVLLFDARPLTHPIGQE